MKYWSRVKNPELAHFFKLEKLEMAQNSNHFCLELIFSSKFEVRILNHLRILKLKKVTHLRKKSRDRYFEQKLKRNLTFRIHISTYDIDSFDGFLSYVRVLHVFYYIGRNGYNGRLSKRGFEQISIIYIRFNHDLWFQCWQVLYWNCQGNT